MERLVELKSGLSIDRVKGEGGAWSPLSVKMHGQAVGWLTTYDGVATPILSPKVKVKPVTLQGRGYQALRLEREER